MSRPPPSKAGARAASSRSQDDSDDDDGPRVGASGAAAAAAPYRTDPRGDELVKDAEKAMKKFAIFDKKGKFEEACEIFEKAAAQYKMNKNWQEAGEVYKRIAEIKREPLKEMHDEAQNYDQAAKCFKNVNTKEAIRCYERAVDFFKENNKFSQAAKIYKEMAAIQEKELDAKGAAGSYEKAAKCYEADNASANAIGMWVKVAAMLADNGDYEQAIKLYEQVSRQSIENQALRWSVKDYLFKALLCHFALAAPTHRLDRVRDKLEKYVDMCQHLDNTREKGLIEDLCQDFEDGDSDKFAEHIFNFDQIIKLDNFSAKVLLDVKRALEGGNPDDNRVDV